MINVGDWAGDGHGQTSNILIKTNATKESFDKAFIDTCKKLEIPYIHPSWSSPRLACCEEYENDTIPLAILDKIEYNYGLLENVVEDDDDQAFLRVDDWISIHFHIASISRPDFWFDYVTVPIINIGGYGLF